MHRALFKFLDHCQEVADRAGQSIEADDDKDVAGGELAKQFVSRRGERAMPWRHGPDRSDRSRRPRLVDLGIVDQIVGGDAGVADQPLEGLWDVNGLSPRNRAFRGLVSMCFVQIKNSSETTQLQACFSLRITARQTKSLPWMSSRASAVANARQRASMAEMPEGSGFGDGPRATEPADGRRMSYSEEGMGLCADSGRRILPRGVRSS